MATIIGRGKPKGFSIMPEGEQNVRITDVQTKSSVQNINGKRMSTVSEVHLTLENEAGDTMKSNYNLNITGGYNAFYYLILNGLGIDLGEDEFDVDSLRGKYIVIEVVHREGTKQKDDGTFPIFANIKRTISQGYAFGGAEEAVADADDDSLYE